MKTFRSVKNRKISERVVRQIKRAILEGIIKPGDRLPPERELVERFRVSRISIREALKNLETFGFLEIKPGSGVFVTEISTKLLSESISSILQIQKSTINDLTEARIILEPSIAKLASERITPEDLLKLEQNIKKTSAMIKSNRSFKEKMIDFHSIISESTHNAVLVLIMRTLFDVLKEQSLKIDEGSRRYIEGTPRHLDSHKKILNALQEKHSQKVSKLIIEHICEIQEGLKKFKL